MIVVVGLSHQTAPIGVRERLALPQDVVPLVLAELVAHPEVAEALLLVTCNRVEVFAAPPPGEGLSRTAAVVVEALEARAPGVAEHLYRHEGPAAVQHVFRVAASLDSLVVGEPQILGQLKDSFATAHTAGTLGPRLNRTVTRAIRSAKRVRTETGLGAGQVSVPSVAIELARQVFGSLAGHNTVLIGSGEMAEAVARLARGDGANLFVVGRNQMRVAELTRAVGGEPRPWAELPRTLVEADVVITSTSAPGHIIDYALVSGMRRARHGRSLFFIDLAVPRDVDPRVEELDYVFAYNIDDFSRVVAGSLASRQREAQRAEAIVNEEACSFARWFDAEQVTPVVVALRRRFLEVLGSELDRTLRGRLKGLPREERASLERMVEAAVKKLLHAPTMRLREIASDRHGEAFRREELTAALSELFELDALASQDSASGSACWDSSEEPSKERESATTEHLPANKSAN